MAAGWTDSLVLVVNMRWRIEGFLQTVGAVEGGRAPQAIDLSYWFRNFDL
jgi:hypothetical protein